MKGLIDKVITVYEMRANAMGVLMANTEKALEEVAPESRKTANEQTKRLDNFVKDLTRDVSDTLTRFWFLKERKQRKHEQMTDDEVRILTAFANFTKTLAKDIRSLTDRFEKTRGQTFEKKFDKEVKQMETYAKDRLKGFDESLEETLTGTRNTWKKRLRQ